MVIRDDRRLLNGKIQGIDGPVQDPDDRVIGRHKYILCQQDNDYVFPQMNFKRIRFELAPDL